MDSEQNIRIRYEVLGDYISIRYGARSCTIHRNNKVLRSDRTESGQNVVYRLRNKFEFELSSPDNMKALDGFFDVVCGEGERNGIHCEWVLPDRRVRNYS
ncbi:hypothetical protein [Endozoicomonas atrinae]|uniref:hypothetical protein n=1 Tax=Endozoicomonas atrinae TaxID=1333660 RepID=UPI000826C232|nr:hypothetical protein [Endozoicomonas atrinae]